LAVASIEHGLTTGAPLEVDPATHPAALRRPGACFVTLRRAGDLRGCIGEIAATGPLVESIASRAFAAAFRDPRFAPLRADETDDLEVEVSVLGPVSPIEAADEAELLRQLRPGIDGVVLRCGPAQATFLPAVWASLPDPELFLAELRRKAGLPPGTWSSELSFHRYPVLEVSGPYRRHHVEEPLGEGA
jgi:hypothetical protein